MKTFEMLQERGYIYQCTNLERLKEKLNNEKLTFYLGIDPTADSLHIGHFFALTMANRLQKMGHKAIILIGGATALIGDPTGKTNMRNVLTKEEVINNKNEVKALIKKFVELDGNNPVQIVDNFDWINKETYIDFLREVGIHFNVNKMLTAECYKSRLKEGGLTFLEMGYMLIQAYDFVHLNNEFGCTLQIGGSDQWANMVAGTNLFRKLNIQNNETKDDIDALTCPLLVKANGEKMGKTSSGTLWVSREKTTVYDFYQMFINSFDEDVERLLAFFSNFEMSKIKELCSNDIVNAKKIMAFEITKLVHGEEEAKKVQQTSKELFSKKNSSENMPTFIIDEEIINSGIALVELMVISNVVATKSEAKRNIEQGGVKINGEKRIKQKKLKKVKKFF